MGYQFRKGFELIVLVILFTRCVSQNDQNRENQNEVIKTLIEQMSDPCDFVPKGKFLRSYECKVHTKAPDFLETFPDGIIPWISIDDPVPDLDDLIDAEQLVTENKKATLVIDYPVSKPIEIEISTKNELGFTLSEIVSIVGREYKRIYEEDYQSAQDVAKKENDTIVTSS